MRRFAATLLLIAFVGQTSGTAVASTPSEAQTFGSSIASVVVPVRDHLVGSRLYAAMTGQMDRYDAAHMPMPKVARRSRQAGAEAANEMSPIRIARVGVRVGIKQILRLPEQPPRTAPRDPRAMPVSVIPVVLHPGVSHLGRRSESFQQSAPGKAGVNPLGSAAVTAATLAASDVGVGIARWWNYTMRKLPGIGTAMLNPGTGNLLVAVDDVEFPERGVNLSFKRFYNSQSRHDVQGDDGAQQSIFGNRWTNDLDMHMVYSPSTGNISLYDATGRRCDYTPYLGYWMPCAGEFASLYPDPNNSCDYWWVQTDGTAYYFRQPGNVSTCGTHSAIVGRLYEIVGRNSNNNIQLVYSYPSGGPYDAEHVTEIDATHSDGQSLALTFEPVGTNGYNELVSIKRPDGAILRYSYDDSGDLVEVDKPGNDETSDPAVAFINAAPYNVPKGDLPETYSPSVGFGQPLELACGPRATISMWANSGAGTDGSCLRFDFNASEKLVDWVVRGVMSFAPNDGTSSAIQAADGGWGSWMTSYFDYDTPLNCTGPNQALTTTTCDTDGHSTVWTLNSLGMVTQEQSSTGDASGPTALVTTQTWKTVNSLAGQPAPYYLLSKVDAANRTTTYSYNQGEESPYMITLPPASVGTHSPYWLYHYGAGGNLVSVCDPAYNSTHGNPTSCPTTTSSGAQVFVYDQTDTAEPQGVLTDTYSPAGYHVHYAYNYNSSQEPGDYGLPTKVIGDPIVQADGTSLQPAARSITYDSLGDITSDSTGGENTTFTYNGQNLAVAEVDPDGIWSYRCYNLDGSEGAVETARQHQLDALPVTTVSCGTNAVSFRHDADGDITGETHHYGGVQGATKRWYDGLDRIVEVEVPGDGNTDGNQPALERYLYDLTQSNGSATLSISGKAATFAGHGNMYKTQRYFLAPTATSSSWNDVNGNSYDALDRAVDGFEMVPAGPIETSFNTYDATVASAGSLSSVVDATKVTKTYAYDGEGRVSAVSYSDGTPTVSHTYDADGRVLVASNAVATDSYTYDAEGHILRSQESGVTDPATITYQFAPNGWRTSETLKGVGATKTYNYVYQADGRMSSLQLIKDWSAGFSWIYTPAGRMKSQSDPYTGENLTGSYYPGGVTIGAKSASYDATTGLLSSMTMPNGMVYNNFGYDAEGELTGYNFSPTGFSSVSQTQYVTGAKYNYDIRGEMSEIDGTDPALPNYETVETVPTMYGYPEACAGASPCSGFTVDPYTGALLAHSIASGGCTYRTSITYDSDGRATVNTASIHNLGTGSCGASDQTFARTRTFDAENRVLTDVCPAGIPNAVPGGGCSASNSAYSWGPDGHVRAFQQNGVTYGLHWDGDLLLLVTQAGAGIQLAAGKLGSTVGNLTSLTVFDGESSGLSVQEHSATGDNGDNVMPDRFQARNSFDAQSLQGEYPGVGSAVALPLIDTQRTDGYKIGNLVMQGARSYDETSSQWMTRDPYKGEPEDPMSQMPYMWNANNPIANLDPSGFCKSTSTGDISQLCTIASECVTPSGPCKAKNTPPAQPNQPQLKLRYGPDPIIHGPPAPAAITMRLDREIQGLNEFGQTAATIGALPIGGPLFEGAGSAISSWAVGGTSVRVFWSGYGLGAQGAAISFARTNGYVTIEMTPAGRVLNVFTNNFTARAVGPVWNGLSQRFASTAEGEFHTFIFNSGAGMTPGETWSTIELPTLVNNPFVTQMIWH